MSAVLRRAAALAAARPGGDGGAQAGKRAFRDGYINPEFRARAWKVYLGSHRVSKDPNVMMVTTLGSCVAACIHDPVAQVGGMNHFLLPEPPAGTEQPADVAARYGGVAMERLINDLLALGARRDRMIVKVFGGARVIDTRYDIGDANARFVIDYLGQESLTLGGQDLGGDAARRLHYFPVEGRAIRRLLQSDVLRGVGRRGRQYQETLLNRSRGDGEIELFEDEQGHG